MNKDDMQPFENMLLVADGFPEEEPFRESHFFGAS